MEAIKSLNLLAIFVLEIALFISFGEIGMGLQTSILWRVLAAVGLVVFVIFMWANWLAPKAKNRLALPWLVLAKSCLFALASLGLHLRGETGSAIILIVAFILTETLALIWRQEQKR